MPFLVTHEPGGTPLGEAIRGVFLDREIGRHGRHGRAAAGLRQPPPAPARGDRAGARGGPARALRPLHRLDPRLPGLRPRRTAGDHRRASTGSRPAGGGPTARCSSTCRRSAPASAGTPDRGGARARSTGWTPRSSRSTSACARAISSSRAREPERFRVVDSSAPRPATEERGARRARGPRSERRRELARWSRSSTSRGGEASIPRSSSTAAGRRLEETAALKLGAHPALRARRAGERPCGVCRHCRRIAWPGERRRRSIPTSRCSSAT